MKRLAGSCQSSGLFNIFSSYLEAEVEKNINYINSWHEDWGRRCEPRNLWGKWKSIYKDL